MTVKKPLAIYDKEIKELQSGDSIELSGCILNFAFTSSDLNNGLYTVNHNLNTTNLAVFGRTDTGISFVADYIILDNNNIQVDLSGQIITNTWQIKVIADGDYTQVTDTIPHGICNAYISGRATDYKAGQISGLMGLNQLYIAQADGDRIALYYCGKWSVYPFNQTKLNLSSLTNIRLYDVFAYWTGSDVAFELCMWGTFANGIDNRITSLTRQNGILVKSGDPSRRYIGTFYWNGGTNDAAAYRMVYNYYNQQSKILTFGDAVAHTYGTGTWRISPNTTQAFMVTGVPCPLKLTASAYLWNGMYVNICLNDTITDFRLDFSINNNTASQLYSTSVQTKYCTGFNHFRITECGGTSTSYLHAARAEGEYKC